MGQSVKLFGLFKFSNLFIRLVLCFRNLLKFVGFSLSGLRARVLFVNGLSRESLREMDGCALFVSPIEVMRKSAPFSNTCANCAAESAVAAVGSMFSVAVRDS